MASDPLVELIDAVRIGDAAVARSRQRRLEQQSEDVATFVGTLLDLAERGSAVALRTSGGRVDRGAVAAVGLDFVVLRSGDRPDVCIRTDAIVMVRPAEGERHPAATGDRPAPLDLLLVEVLVGLAADRPRVALVAGGELVSGELRSVGADVVTLRLDGERRPLCYLSVAAIDTVVFDPA